MLPQRCPGPLRNRQAAELRAFPESLEPPDEPDEPDSEEFDEPEEEPDDEPESPSDDEPESDEPDEDDEPSPFDELDASSDCLPPEPPLDEELRLSLR